MNSLIRLKHIIEYIFLYCFIHLLWMLPFQFSIWILKKLSDFVFFVLKVRVNVTINNLKIAFGNTKSEKELYSIARKTYQNFFITGLEMMYFARMTPEKLKKLVKFDGIEHFDNALKKGRGAVLVSGHFGNAELMGLAMQAYGLPMRLVAGEQRNKYVDRLLNNYRKKAGAYIIPRKHALRQVLKLLKDNEVAAIMSDQNAGPTGIFVDFFGKPASTPQGAALFTTRTNSTLIFGIDMPNQDRTRHTAYFKPVEIKLTDDKDKDVFLLTQEFTKMLEDYARKYPEHYFWLHKRWKAKPPLVAKPQETAVIQ